MRQHRSGLGRGSVWFCGIGAVVAMVGVFVDSCGAVVRMQIGRRVSGVLLLRMRARHVDGGGHRMQRERGHQEPDQQCREQTIHKCGEYSTGILAPEQVGAGGCDGATRARNSGLTLPLWEGLE